MDKFSREKLADLIQYIPYELPSGFFSDTHDIFRNAPLYTYLIWPAGTAEPRIAGQSCDTMSRNLYLRNRNDMPVLGILHDFPDIILCIESAIRLVYKRITLFAGIVRHVCTFSDRTDFSQARILLNFDSPALILSQMPVESVQLMHSHHVDEGLHILH